MRSFPVGVIVAAVFLVGRAGGAQEAAQDTLPRVGAQRLLQGSVGGGFAKISSTPLSRTTHGCNLQASLATRRPFDPLRIRFDGPFGDAGNTQVQAFTGGATLAAPARWTVSPFALAGGGGYIPEAATPQR